MGKYRSNLLQNSELRQSPSPHSFGMVLFLLSALVGICKPMSAPSPGKQLPLKHSGPSLGSRLSSGTSVKHCLSKKQQLLILVWYITARCHIRLGPARKWVSLAQIIWQLLPYELFSPQNPANAGKRIKQQAVYCTGWPAAAPAQPKGVTAACWWWWLATAHRLIESQQDASRKDISVFQTARLAIPVPLISAGKIRVQTY